MNMNSFKENIEIKINNLSLNELVNIHIACDEDFIPRLSSRVNIIEYCNKLFQDANIISLHLDKSLIGVLAIYCNNMTDKKAYISSICIFKKFRGKGLSKILLVEAIKLAKGLGFNKIKLEVGKDNLQAIKLYNNFGFKPVES